jgi:ABC-2 type transport system permease protein
MDRADVVSREGLGPRFWRRLLRYPTTNLVLNLTMREISSQYKRTMLGRVWSLVNPLATIATFSVIFGLFFGQRIAPGVNSGLTSYALYVACGIIPWGFISTGIMTAMGSLTDNAGLLSKVYFPRHALVMSAVLSNAWTFITELVMLMVVMAVAGGPRVLLSIPLLLVVVAINVVFVLGVGLTLSVLVVYFRDVKHIWALFTQIWFYASGIVFTIGVVSTGAKTLAERGFGWVPLLPIFEANPAYQFISAYRALLFEFTVPGLVTWGQIVLAAVISLAVGILVFTKFQARIVEEL